MMRNVMMRYVKKSSMEMIADSSAWNEGRNCLFDKAQGYY